MPGRLNRLIDLTHVLTPDIPSWAGDCGFRLTIDTDYDDCRGPDYFRTHEITQRAGMGTHLDAPAHCFRGGKTVEDLSLENLITECVVINVESRLERKLDSSGANAVESFVTGPDIVADFEATHGRIPENAFVIFHTGWGRRWGNAESYRNSLRFPSIHEDTAQLLLSRNIAGLGTDTLSADSGGKLYPVHRVMLGAGRYLVENIANSEQLPPVGMKIFIMPMKIGGGAEAPIRLVAAAGY